MKYYEEQADLMKVVLCSISAYKNLHFISIDVGSHLIKNRCCRHTINFRLIEPDCDLCVISFSRGNVLEDSQAESVATAGIQTQNLVLDTATFFRCTFFNRIFFYTKGDASGGAREGGLPSLQVRPKRTKTV